MSKLQKAYERSRVPLYIQVASVLRQRIESKRWQAGQKIPTLVELEKEFHVARVTVRQAVEILREEGLLFAQQGRGTFVVDAMTPRHWVKLATDWNVLIDMIKENVPKRIKVESSPDTPKLVDGEGKPAPEYVFLRSVQFKNGEPYGVVNVYLADSIFRRNPRRFTEHPALVVLAECEDIRIKHAHQTLVIGSANPEMADLLKVALGAPTAECRCVVVDENGIAIYIADITYRGDVVKLHIDLFARRRSHAAITRARDKRHIKNESSTRIRVLSL